jgi:ATP-dependent RNA helicase DHX57
VTVVVDSCRVKEMGYDATRQLPRLQECWAAKDALTQRSGRAGRVRAGEFFAF